MERKVQWVYRSTTLYEPQVERQMVVLECGHIVVLAEWQPLWAGMMLECGQCVAQGIARAAREVAEAYGQSVDFWAAVARLRGVLESEASSGKSLLVEQAEHAGGGGC